MNKTQLKPCDKAEKILVDTEELKFILSCGRASAVKIGEEARAKVSVGRRVLWNIEKVHKYINKKDYIIL